MILNEDNYIYKNKKKFKDYSEIEQNPDDEREELYKIKVFHRYNNYKNNKYNNNKYNNNSLYSRYNLFLIIFIILVFILCIAIFIFSIPNKYIFNKNQIKQSDTTNDNQTKINSNTIYKKETNNIIEIKSNIENKNNNKKYSQNVTNNNNNTMIEKRKISIAFVYSILYANGIARFITLTANYLIKTGKYDIYLLTGNSNPNDYKYDSRIKRVFTHKNRTLIKNFTKHVKIDFFILQNVMGEGAVKFYKSIGKNVIGIFHGMYMSAMFHGVISSYKKWHLFDKFDAFIFISSDDYFFYKKLGYKNEIFIPNLYTFEPSEVRESNLTNHNIMMLGRAADKIKGFIYAINTLPYIVKEVPDAILNIASSNYKLDFLEDRAKELNVSKNLLIKYFVDNITEVFWNSSVMMYTSLSEAFPMAMNEGKAHGLPIVAFNVQNSIPYQNGVINVDMLDCKALAKETVKLLKDYEYRKKMGKEAKLSLNKFNNNETVELWGRLFNSLLEGEEAYRRLQDEIEKKYYNEEKAREHVEKHYEDLLKMNENFTCHHINNFTDINYVKNIQMCNISNHTSQK